jgi:hypothetical protein
MMRHCSLTCAGLWRRHHENVRSRKAYSTAINIQRPAGRQRPLEITEKSIDFATKAAEEAPQFSRLNAPHAGSQRHLPSFQFTGLVRIVWHAHHRYLGTSNSAAAVMRGGRPNIIPSAEGVTLGGKAFPSFVALTADGQISIAHSLSHEHSH